MAACTHGHVGILNYRQSPLEVNGQGTSNLYDTNVCIINLPMNIISNSDLKSRDTHTTALCTSVQR